jgi:hypothetical protein
MQMPIRLRPRHDRQTAGILAAAADPADLDAVDPIPFPETEMEPRSKMALITATAVDFVGVPEGDAGLSGHAAKDDLSL